MMPEPGTAAPIRTPDQRLRVFVSSTLRELATERTAVRRAIERLYLAPVMFELGARPHPPRDLYRAYLAQSDVFIGIYAQQYGWIAPAEQISGLEDEYRLASRTMPKLIYIKEGVERDARLVELIHRIQADDTVSYKGYSSASELAELVAADLATLLAERFDAARTPEPMRDEPTTVPVPVAYTQLIGRSDDVRQIVSLLANGDDRVVTLLGPGGIGKSRLAIAAAKAAADDFPGGVVFVSLENVLEPELLLPAIAYALGIRDTGEAPLEHRLGVALAGRRTLVLLDNFEQLVDAAPTLVRLFTIAPEAQFLVTSRVLLRIRGERVWDVATLEIPEPGDGLPRLAASPAVRLFVERARAVKPDFALTEANAEDVTGLCRELDGLPLAIELAAARVRMLTPHEIRARLGHDTTLLASSSRDLPERQRTLRATLEWSTDLLDDSARAMLQDLGVFAGSFTLEAIEAIADGRPWEPALLDALGALIDGSLVRQQEVEGQPLYSMLATVREHAVEQLRATGSERRMRDAHAQYVVVLADRSAPLLGGPHQLEIVARIDQERANLRAAVRHLISIGDADTTARIAWPLYLYWWLRGYVPEVRVWMQELIDRIPGRSARADAMAQFYVLWSRMWSSERAELVAGLDASAATLGAEGDTFGQALAAATAGLARATSGPAEMPRAVELLETSATEFHRLGVGWAEALCLVALGRLAWVRGDPETAMSILQRANDATVAAGDVFVHSVTAHHVGRAHLFAGDLATSARFFRDAIGLSMSIQHDEGVAYGIEGLCAIAGARDDALVAATLAGAAEAIRRRVTMFDIPAFVYHTDFLLRAAANADPDAVAQAMRHGAELPVPELVEYALAHVPE